MTTVPKRPLGIFVVLPFESSFALAMLLLAIGSIASGGTPSGALQGALDTFLYGLWRWGLVLFALGVLITILLRPWAAQRATMSQRERTLATLRAYESAACIGLATSCGVYALTITWDRLDGAGFVAAALLSFAWGFVQRARYLIRENAKRLSQLRVVNAAID